MNSRSKTVAEPYTTARRLEPDAQGVWHVFGYAEARAILLADSTTQAGFKAELLTKMPKYMALPILYQEGQEHREQRVQTARFFTPTVTHQKYLSVMERCADRVIAGFKQTGWADLNQLTTRMATTVVAEVIGLPEGSIEHISYHLNGILHANITWGLSPRAILNYVIVQWHLLNFFLFDVRPTLRARRSVPQEDVISYLLSKNRRPLEILTECIMYAAAGMVTTQEFICAGVWHCLQNPDLRALMLSDDEEARYRFLYELLRLEPVVGHIYRRNQSALVIASDSQTITVPAGALIDLHVYSINADARAVGSEPLSLWPERKLEKRIHRAVMGFGAGAHQCAGEFVAIAESDIFMRRLLALDGLRIEQEPEIGRSDITSGYALRHFIVALNSKD